MGGLAPYDEEPYREALVSLRRDLHRHPEIGFTERRTSQLIHQRLLGSGLEVREMAGTGLLATLRGGKPGPAILLRAELDALPIQEASDVPYRSVHDGVMHA